MDTDLVGHVGVETEINNSPIITNTDEVYGVMETEIRDLRDLEVRGKCKICNAGYRDRRKPRIHMPPGFD